MSLYTKFFNPKYPIVIALDGPSASGKSAIGQMLAEKFNLQYYQSGLLYRVVALACFNKKIDMQDHASIVTLSKNINPTAEIDTQGLYNEEIGAIASAIATIPDVRNILNLYQQKIIQESHRIIMEGRDIGTIIAPQANLKLFITADLEIRARRRYKQLRMSGKECILQIILQQLQIRDVRDKERNIAPLVPAQDALIIDTSNLTLEEILSTVQDFVLIK